MHLMNLLRNAFACIVMIAACDLTFAREVKELDGGETITTPLTDPSRPATIHIGLVFGSITVIGSDIKDVIVEVGGSAGHKAPLPDEARGLRRVLPAQPLISIEEENNRVEIVSPAGNRPVRLDIQVPKKTNLELSTVNAGNIEVTGVEGELELGNVNGTIELTDVSGAVVAHTVNGRVLATLSRVTPDKPMAFTSLNGVIDVTLPPAIKANVKLRTDNGSAYTDFDMQMLPQAGTTIEDTHRESGRYRINVNKVIYGAVNGGGPDIEMRTFNGSIYLRKGGGASPNPAPAPEPRRQ
jgi:hypothetical protein